MLGKDLMTCGTRSNPLSWTPQTLGMEGRYRRQGLVLLLRKPARVVGGIGKRSVRERFLNRVA